MIYLDRNPINELGLEEYMEMYKGVFGKWEAEGNCPAEVYTGYDDGKYLGFLAGYPTSLGCWYLQRGGFLKNEQGKFGNLRIYLEALKELHKWWPCIRTHVDNNDLPALKMALNAGFRIIGIRSLNGKVEVEMIRYQEEENAEHIR